jgi:serine/threonine-protein kinase
MNSKAVFIDGSKGKYELFTGSLLKAGGKFGLLCKARDVQNNQMLSARVVLLSNIDAIAWERFKREISFQHLPEGFSETVDFAKSNDRLFIFRKYYPGLSLDKLPEAKWYQFGSKPWQRIVEYFVHAAFLLEKLHQSGIIHNDIRPSNLIFSKEEHQPFHWSLPLHPAYIDLGLAVSIKELNQLKQLPYALSFSPPELILEHYSLLSPASDIYALALTLFQVLSGEKPFLSDHPELSLQLQINMPLPKDDDIPENLYNVLKKATTKFSFPKPPNRYPKAEVANYLQAAINARYQTAGEFGRALLTCLK